MVEPVNRLSVLSLHLFGQKIPLFSPLTAEDRGGGGQQMGGRKTQSGRGKGEGEPLIWNEAAEQDRREDAATASRFKSFRLMN